MTIFRSKITILALAVFSAWVLSAVSSQAQTPSAERLALAKAYIATMPLESDIKTAVESMATSIKPEQRALFRSLADKSIDYNKLRTSAELISADIFTDEELKAMTAFFSTPEGKSIQAKLPAYEQRITPVISEVLSAFVVKLQENNVIPSATTPAQ
jgi:hypothetical protein